MKVATLEKFHFRGGENQDPGDPVVEKIRRGRIFSFKQGGRLTQDDTMVLFLINEAYFRASRLIFNVPQHIPRTKQTFETLERSIFIQTILDHFESPLSMSFQPFSEKCLR